MRGLSPVSKVNSSSYNYDPAARDMFIVQFAVQFTVFEPNVSGAVCVPKTWTRT
jgi:hypothetical protein